MEPEIIDKEFILKRIEENDAYKREQARFNDDISKRIEGLATKEDIQILQEELKGYLIGGNIFKYAFNNGGKITGLLGLLVIIFLIFKYGFLGLVAFFFQSLLSK